MDLFLRLIFRHAGMQPGLDLGANEVLAGEVLRVLQAMPTPLRERRECDRQVAPTRAALREQQRDFDRELRRVRIAAVSRVRRERVNRS